MGKKISECCDQWSNLQTMALADKMEVDDFKPIINNCSSIEELDDQVRDSVNNSIENCRQEFGELDPNNTMQIMALASLNNIDVDQLVKIILGCYESRVRLYKLESRVNRLYERFVKSASTVNERESTPAHDGEVAAMDIAMKFDKDDLEIDSDVDVKNKKDAWILRLVYNDGNREDLKMVKPDDDKRDYVMTSDKDNLKVNFSDKDSKDNTLEVPKSVIDHIAKHIEQAEENIADDKKNNDSDLAKEIAYDIKKEFPNYDMEVIEGDVGSTLWSIQIVYKDGSKDSFTVLKAGKGNYLMKSKDGFVAKYTLDELKKFPKDLSDHILKHAKKSV